MSDNIEELAARTFEVLNAHLDLIVGLSGPVSPEHAEALWSLACAYKELASVGDDLFQGEEWETT